jgi:hypothetical protein
MAAAAQAAAAGLCTAARAGVPAADDRSGAPRSGSAPRSGRREPGVRRHRHRLRTAHDAADDGRDPAHAVLDGRRRGRRRRGLLGGPRARQGGDGRDVRAVQRAAVGAVEARQAPRLAGAGLAGPWSSRRAPRAHAGRRAAARRSARDADVLARCRRRGAHRHRAARRVHDDLPGRPRDQRRRADLVGLVHDRASAGAAARGGGSRRGARRPGADRSRPHAAAVAEPVHQGDAPSVSAGACPLLTSVDQRHGDRRAAPQAWRDDSLDPRRDPARPALVRRTGRLPSGALRPRVGTSRDPDAARGCPSAQDRGCAWAVTSR